MTDRAASHIRNGVCGVLGVIILGIHAAPVCAQDGIVRGVVLDTKGAPLAGADVGITALRRLTRTDDSGRFVFARVPVGPVELSVRRLAYEPGKIAAVSSEAGSDVLQVILKGSAALLDGIQVTAGEMRRREQIEDFHRRRVRGLGTFITRDQIDERASGAPSDMLRSVPGIRFVKVPSGRGIRFPTTSISRRDCAPMIWID